MGALKKLAAKRSQTIEARETNTNKNIQNAVQLVLLGVLHPEDTLFLLFFILSALGWILMGLAGDFLVAGENWATKVAKVLITLSWVPWKKTATRPP